MNVILYHQDGCGQCKTAELLLSKSKVSYTSCKDVEVMRSKGITKTPVLEVDGQLLVGKLMIDWIKGQGER